MENEFDRQLRMLRTLYSLLDGFQENVNDIVKGVSNLKNEIVASIKLIENTIGEK